MEFVFAFALFCRLVNIYKIHTCKNKTKVDRWGECQRWRIVTRCFDTSYTFNTKFRRFAIQLDVEAIR